jgi:hypothetical protein
VNLKLFDVLGRLALTGLWLLWLIGREQDDKQKSQLQVQLAKVVTSGYQVINNNRALFLPIQDQQAIEVSLFLVLAVAVGGSPRDVSAWLTEMAQRLDFSVRTRGRYPCVFTAYRDLVVHPRDRSDEYLKEATSGSVLIPLIAAFLTGLKDAEGQRILAALKEDQLKDCTLQLWMPDGSSEDALYSGGRDHGVSLSDLPLPSVGDELLLTVRDACEKSSDFVSLSAVAAGFWPIILTACRHYRMPVPPQFWINLVSPAPPS